MKKAPRPPRLAGRLLEWYCQQASVEDLYGDLDELFYHDVQNLSVQKARLRYWRQVLSLVFSYAIKRRKEQASYHAFSSSTITIFMLKNYFQIASRSLAKHKVFTIINVVGLSVGMSVGLLFIALLSFLWTYDNFHLNKDSIYRVISRVDDNVRNRDYASAPLQLADRIQQEYPGVQNVVRISATLNTEVVYERKELSIQGYFVEPGFFEMFSFSWLKGNSRSLERPNTIALTEKAAKRIVGDVDPVGKTITIGELGDFEIIGLLRDHPKNSHMQFEALASFATLEKPHQAGSAANSSWTEFHNSYVYLLVPDANVIAGLQHYLNGVSEEVYSNEKDFTASFELQALNDIVPGRILSDTIGADWDYASLAVFAALALMILLPACFNYTNISISRALKRMKEVGLRKVMGGAQRQIFFQFIVETVLITLVALIFSYPIFHYTRGEFLSMLVGGADLVSLDLTGTIVVLFILFALGVGLIAGIVPALYFSKLSPVQALKSKPVGKVGRRLGFRKVLIVGQFALSLGFITGVVIVLNQYRQTLSFDFGFEQANILDVPLQNVDPEIFRHEFSKLADVQRVSMSSGIPGATAIQTCYVHRSDRDSSEVYQMFVDEHYLPNLRLKLLAGQNFTSTEAGKAGVIVNEEFLKEFGIDGPLSAVGQSFVLVDKSDITIVGVVKNFHYAELREPVRSFFFRYDPSQFEYANLKITSADMLKTFTQLEEAWKQVGGEKKFTAKFFDDEIEETYSFYLVMVKMCAFLGFLAITISCLGLLGMVIFVVENRTKEVGIRKVMGASSVGIMYLLSKDFVKLMIIAAMVSLPLTYLFFDKIYLRTVAFKTPIGVMEIVVSLLIMVTLGIVTILSQTARAASVNPVDTMRCE